MAIQFDHAVTEALAGVEHEVHAILAGVDLTGPSPTDAAIAAGTATIIHRDFDLNSRLYFDGEFADRWIDAMDDQLGGREIDAVPPTTWRRLAGRAQRLALAA